MGWFIIEKSSHGFFMIKPRVDSTYLQSYKFTFKLINKLLYNNSFERSSLRDDP